MARSCVSSTAAGRFNMWQYTTYQHVYIVFKGIYIIAGISECFGDLYPVIFSVWIAETRLLPGAGGAMGPNQSPDNSTAPPYPER